MGAALLGVACPPWYLSRRRRWVGAALIGLVWIVGVTFVSWMLYAIALYPVRGLMAFLLAVGLLIWLMSGLLAWLWGRWPLVGAVVWVIVAFWTAVMLFNIFIEGRAREAPRRPPSAPPGPTGRLEPDTMRTPVDL